MLVGADGLWGQGASSALRLSCRLCAVPSISQVGGAGSEPAGGTDGQRGRETQLHDVGGIRGGWEAGSRTGEKPHVARVELEL